MRAAFSQEELQREMDRNRAVTQSGYSFAVLELKEKKKCRVSGINTPMSKVTEDGTFEFVVVARQLQFEADISRGNTMTAYVMIDEHNKKFLASHFPLNYWEIVAVMSGRDNESITLDEFLSEIADLSRKQMSESVITGPLYPNSSNKNHDPMFSFSIDELEDELAKRKVKIVNVDISDEDFAKLPPGEKGKITKARNAMKPQVVESGKRPDIIVDDKRDPVKSTGLVESNQRINSSLLMGVNKS